MVTRTRTYRITLDLSDDERRMLAELAERLGVSMQGVLRMALRKLSARSGE
jgi:hypothetical protein